MQRCSLKHRQSIHPTLEPQQFLQKAKELFDKPQRCFQSQPDNGCQIVQLEPVRPSDLDFESAIERIHLCCDQVLTLLRGLKFKAKKKQDEVKMKGYRENSCTSKQSPVGIAPHLSNKVLVMMMMMIVIVMI